MSKAYIKFMSQVMTNMPKEDHCCRCSSDDICDCDTSDLLYIGCLIVYMRDYNHLLFEYFTDDMLIKTINFMIRHSTMVDNIYNKKSLEPQDYLIKYFLDRMNKE